MLCARAVTHGWIPSFALENVDAIGQWRETDQDVAIDAKTVLPDGTTVDGPVAFRKALLARHDANLVCYKSQIHGALGD